jgi:hypothetical protein
MASIADVSVMDLTDETRRIAITSADASAFHYTSARHHPANGGGLHPRDCPTSGSFCLSSAGDTLKLPWTLAATMLCHASLMHPLSGSLRDANFRSERDKCGLLPDTQGRPNHDRPADHPVTSRDACEGAGID